MFFKNWLFYLILISLMVPDLSFARGGGADTGGAGDYGKMRIFS